MYSQNREESDRIRQSRSKVVPRKGGSKHRPAVHPLGSRQGGGNERDCEQPNMDNNLLYAWIQKKRKNEILKWAQLGTIQRPPDYESGALTS